MFESCAWERVARGSEGVMTLEKGREEGRAALLVFVGEKRSQYKRSPSDPPDTSSG